MKVNYTWLQKVPENLETQSEEGNVLKVSQQGQKGIQWDKAQTMNTQSGN